MSTAALAVPSVPAVARRVPVNKWIVTISISFGTLMGAIDSSIVSVALPHIRGSVGATLQEITAISTGYAVALVLVMPLRTYLVANFKETQIDRMRPGSRAAVTIDAFPGRTFEATVESLAAGTGSRFSLIPPDNASGNFVKVVQRVPVRLAWTAEPGVALKAGLSADVTVFVGESN